ncbi:MAG: UDP-N-acetylmuramoyl-tripeptide--D-alanyl-D-alanine ligase [Nocardioides sp.]
MIPLTLAQIAEIVGGERYAEATVTAPSFLDSRQAVPGGLFVALAGEHSDGHQHAASAHAAGAAATLAARPVDGPCVVVPDVEAALAALARHVLDATGPRVLALTGSQGKTGTKDLLGQVLGRAGTTVATLGNLNNQLGVPLTVLRTTPDTAYLVLEMGARGIGHIAELCRIAPPEVAAVLNVGTAHMGEFGSREAIARAKGEIVEALPADGTAVLNADDDLVRAMAGRTRARVLSFGEAGDVRWRGLELDDLGRPSFELGHDGGWERVRLIQPGAHQVANAAAAAAMALAAGLPLDEIAQGLREAVALSRWRMELHERSDGLVVVNDSYNANPASMRAAVDALEAIGRRSGRRTVAVLGVMLELGETAEAEHTDLGRYAADAGVDVLVTVGADADEIAAGARAAAVPPELVVATAGRDEATEWVRENVRARDAVLVKASRGAALDVLADRLVEDL